MIASIKTFKTSCIPAFVLTMMVALAITCLATMAPSTAFAAEGNPMYRLYNPNSGEHFYTANISERDEVAEAGWVYEGVGWVAPNSGDSVYRLYNPYAGEHHYTLDAAERKNLLSKGWRDEGVGWLSSTSTAVPLYREYNPNQYSCNHNYTTSKSEHNNLTGLGWRDEGIGWYALSKGYNDGASLGYDTLNGTFVAFGGSAPQALSSMSLSATEMKLVGTVRRTENGAAKESVGNKRWTFGVNANTVYGFAVWDGFHRQTKADFSKTFSPRKFTALNLEIKDGTVTRAYYSA